MPAKKHYPDKQCQNCGKFFNRSILPSGRLESSNDFEKRKFCCFICYSEWNCAENHYLFNPEGNRREDGYIRIAVDGERIYKHRYIMEKFLGRKLKKHEHVHHKDGNNENNSIENLEILDNSTHRKIHTISQKRNNEGQFTK